MKLVAVPYDSDVYFNEEDKYYHVFDVNGPVLVAKFSGNNRFSSDSFVDMSNNGESFTYGSIDEENRIRNYYSYTEFILQDMPLKVNKDGVYPVTEDIYNFLHFFAQKNGSWMTGISIDQVWLAFCYYYSENPNVTGLGTQEVPYYLDMNNNLSLSFYVNVTAENPNVYAVLVGMGAFNVSAESSDARLTINGSVTEADSNGLSVNVAADRRGTNLSFSSKSGSAVKYLVTVGLGAPDGSYSNPYDLEDYAQDSQISCETNYDGVYYKYESLYDGQLTVTSLDDNAFIDVNEGNLIEGANSFILDVAAGDTVLVFISTADMSADTIEFKYSFAEKVAGVGSISGGAGTEDDPYIIQDLGWFETYVDANNSDGVFYSFTPSANGTFKLSTEDGNAYIMSSSGAFDLIDLSGERSFEVAADIPVVFSVLTSDWSSDNIDFTVEFDEKQAVTGDPDGSDENPYVMDGVGEYTVELKFVYNMFIQSKWYKFVPSVSGTYKIYSESFADGQYSVYPSSNVTDEALASSMNEQFGDLEYNYLTVTLNAGTAYYIYVGANSTKDVTFKFKVEKI